MTAIQTFPTGWTKGCPKCREMYTASTFEDLRAYFHTNTSRKDGLQVYCRNCQTIAVLVGRVRTPTAVLVAAKNQSHISHSARRTIADAIAHGGVVGWLDIDTGLVTTGTETLPLEAWKQTVTDMRMEMV